MQGWGCEGCSAAARLVGLARGPQQACTREGIMPRQKIMMWLKIKFKDVCMRAQGGSAAAWEQQARSHGHQGGCIHGCWPSITQTQA